MTAEIYADRLFSFSLIAARMEDIAARIVERGGASKGDGLLLMALARAGQWVAEAEAGAALGWRAPVLGGVDTVFAERFAIELGRIVGDDLAASPGADRTNVAVIHASPRGGRSV